MTGWTINEWSYAGSAALAACVVAVPAVGWLAGRWYARRVRRQTWAHRRSVNDADRLLNGRANEAWAEHMAMVRRLQKAVADNPDATTRLLNDVFADRKLEVVR